MDAPSSPPRVLVAPDKFRGTMTARAAARAMAAGVRDAFPDADVDLCPVADGGEGTLEALEVPLRLSRRTARVSGPLGGQVDADWGIDVVLGVAVVELAQAAGLWRIPESLRDPTRSTTIGVATLVLDAIEAGATRVLVGLGGSATCDGGCGVARGLGAIFRDGHGGELTMDGGPRDGATRVGRVEGAPRRAAIEALCDVDNVLLGPRGAARTFAPQKGATAADVEWLESMLERLAHAPVDGADASHLAGMPGAGAAGGAGFGLAAWCGAALRRGAEVVLDAVGFDARAEAADLVVVGEGRIDRSTFDGKAVACAVRRAAAIGRPVFAVAGACAPAEELGREAPPWWRRVTVTSLAESFGEASALERPEETLRRATRLALAGAIGRPGAPIV